MPSWPSLEEAVKDIQLLPADAELAIDTETTGLDLYVGDELRGVSVAYRDPLNREVLRSAYFPLSHPNSPNLTPKQVRALRDALNHTHARHDFHNATFDWKALSQIGVVPRFENYYDSSSIAWMENENNPSGLKPQGQRWLDADANEEQRALKEIMKGIKAKDLYDFVRPGIRKGKLRIAQEWARERAAASKKTWATLTYDDIAEYAAKDTVLTLRLGEMQRAGETDEYLGDAPIWPAFDNEHAVRGVVYRMTDAGVLVDMDRVHELAVTYSARIAEIEPEFEGVNLASPDQLADLLFNRWGLEPTHYTKGGKPSTDKDTLAELEGSHPGIDLLLEYRKLTKMLGTYLLPMSTWADSDGRVHSQLNVIGTVTGRLSSSHPNMQNIPKTATDDSVKKLFVPPTGMELFEYDLHSAELYVGASLAHDYEMQRALSEPGRNFHAETADGIFGRHDEPYYTLAKNLNYGIPYGIGPAKFALYLVKGLRKPMSPALIAQSKTIIDGHRRLWPATHRAIRRVTKFAEENDFLPMIVEGRYRHFSGWNVQVPSYTAWNAAVQGGVAEIMKMLMLAAERPLAELGARMVLQVHDSLWIEQPPGMEAQVLALLQQTLDDLRPVAMRLLIDSKRLN